MATAGVKKILLIEDETELRELFSVLLEMEHYEVIHAGDGEQGLRVFAAEGDQIALVITDLNIPRMSGLDLIGKVRQMSQRVKIIGMSGVGSPDMRALVLDAGANDFLSKPFNPGTAVEAVKNLLE